uniref:HEPN domain-containing protein n=1 Tax=Panagrellus redivivus TaxID=6233 RepID=A0A7E4ZV41_PANRE
MSGPELGPLPNTAPFNPIDHPGTSFKVDAYSKEPEYALVYAIHRSALAFIEESKHVLNHQTRCPEAMYLGR